MTRTYREVDELVMPEERDTLPAPPPSELVHTIPAPALPRHMERIRTAFSTPRLSKGPEDEQ